MAAKLSLQTRKNIKDNEPKMEAHVAKIAQITGVTFDIEVDWFPLFNGLHSSCRESVGSFVFDKYLAGFSKNVERFCGNAIQRDSFVDTFLPRHTISYAIHSWVERPPNTQRYSWVSNDSGILIIHFYDEKVVQGADEIGLNLSEACSGSESPLSVNMRKNIDDTKTAALKHLATIFELTGVEFEYEVDWVEVAQKTAKSGYGPKDSIGSLVHDTYLGSFAKRLESFAKDPIQKATFAELCGERKMLSFKIQEEQLSPQQEHWMTYDDGVLIINVGQYWYGARTDNVGANLDEALSSVGGLSSNARKNINDALPALEKNLASIEEATGLVFEVDVDWDLMNRQSRSSKDIAGEIVYDWYLSGLAKHITKYCEHPVLKEAIIDSFGARRTIAFHIHDETPDAHRYDKVWTTNEDGILTINFEKLGANQEYARTYCGQDLKKSCSQGELTLEARLDIYDTMPARAKIMERVLAATGVDYEVEVDWKVWTPASDRLFKNCPGTAVNKYLDAFATNLTKLCTDDLCKEAFVEAVYANQIYFRIISQEELGGIYVDCTCSVSDEGILNINTSVDRCGKNFGNCGSDLDKVL